MKSFGWRWCIHFFGEQISFGPRMTKLSNLVVVAPIDLCFCTMISTGKISKPTSAQNVFLNLGWKMLYSIHSRDGAERFTSAKVAQFPSSPQKKAQPALNWRLFSFHPAPSQRGTIQPSQDVGLVAIFCAVSRSPTIQTRRSSLAKILIVLFALA